MTVELTRRRVLAGAGALTLFWAWPGAARAQTETGTGEGGSLSLAGSLNQAPLLDAWIRIDAAGEATIFTGKAELGQGIKTALMQIAAEELKLPMDRLTLVTADTARTANEGYTAASHSVQDSGGAIRNAAAQVRDILRGEAAKLWALAVDEVRAESGFVVAGSRRVAYRDLVRDELLHVKAQPTSRLTDPSEFTVMNRPVKRVDIPGKVTGAAAYIQDMRPEGMLHARVIRPPSYGAELASLDASAVSAMPGVVKVLRDGSFLAVVAEREWTAIQAMRTLGTAARWRETAELPDEERLAEALLAQRSDDTTILDRGIEPQPAPAEALFSRPFLSHGSIGPSCAIAVDSDGEMTVWTHTQGVFPLRDAIAGLLGRPKDRVRCIHAEGSGCYGQNGADDVGADAAMIAKALPGRPIRVQWMREQEHAWEPFGPGMVVKVASAVDADGVVSSWRHEVWSSSHAMRPGPPGTLLAARDKADPFPPAPPVALAQPEGGGDRNAIPLYNFRNARVVHHFLPDMPIRCSAMRSLGAHLNVFAIESTMDDLARSSEQDPVAFRLRHLDDPRARDVVAMAADRFGWASRLRQPGLGHGFAFARYKNLAAYCAVALELAIAQDTGRPTIRRIVAAIDTGQVVNPDGVRNQVEGGILQSMSWTLFERVTFDKAGITSVDWSSYPILRFADVPGRIDVHIIDRPGAPFLGVGETAQGPAGAAIANGVADATGRRLRELPLTPERIKAA
jgi:nicotinate dehydrogenase subunit B